MKTNGTFILAFLLCSNFIVAQDTLYIYKAGAVLYKQDVNTIDSVTFKKTISESSIVKDIDGNEYHTVTIGTQTWMVENLKTTKYRNGDPIPNVVDITDWGRLTSGAYCIYNNDNDKGDKYGKLYNWYVANESRKIAPVGWHVPTNAEWQTLTNFVRYNLGTSGSLSKALAAKTDWAPTAYWDPAGAIGNDILKNNSSGFTALPGGLRFNDGSYGFVTKESIWWGWSKEEYEKDLFYYRSLEYNSIDIKNNLEIAVDHCGFYIRCLKD